MKKVKLLPNHKRSMSSSIHLIEKLADEVEVLLTNYKTLETQTVERDIPDDEKKVVMEAVREIKDEVKRLSEKYDLKKQVVLESRFLDSRKTKAWEILNNSEAKRMDAFGKFPEEIRSEYNADIKRLLELVSKL